MLKKIIAGLCAAGIVISCAVFCGVDAARGLDGPLFYHHYITYNVRAAYRDAVEGTAAYRNPFPAVKSESGSWIGIAAAINTRHMLSIQSATMDLGELGVYTMEYDPLVDVESYYDLLYVDPSANPIADSRFKMGISPLAFSPEDLAKLAQSITTPVVVEHITVTYTYDGDPFTQEVPIGKIMLYSGDFAEDHGITSNPYGMALSAGGSGPIYYLDYFKLNIELSSGYRLLCWELPYAEKMGGFVSTGTEYTESEASLGVDVHYAERGLLYFQLDPALTVLDPNGGQITVYSDTSLCTCTYEAENVLHELKSLKGGVL